MTPKASDTISLVVSLSTLFLVCPKSKPARNRNKSCFVPVVHIVEVGTNTQNKYAFVKTLK